MANQSQRETLNSIEKPNYNGFGYLENDMLFVKDNKSLSPEPFDFSRKKKGIIKNKWIAYPNKNSMISTFEYKFNQWLYDNSPFRTKSDLNESSTHDPRYKALTFVSTESRLARDADIESSNNKYSQTRFNNEKDRVLTYKYRLNYKTLAERLYGITNNGEDWEFGKKDEQQTVKDLNILIIQKRVHSLLNRFLEIQSKDTFNRYFGDCTDKLFTEFPDSYRSSDSLGVLFFTEVESEIDGSVTNLFPSYNGSYDNGDYDVAQFDLKNSFPDDFDTDPIGNNSTLWYAPFEIQSISSSDLLDDEFVEIEILVPNGIRYNNEAKIAWLDTRCRVNNSRIAITDCLCDGSPNIPSTLQIDGLINAGLPSGYTARINFLDKNGYKRVIHDKSLTVLGTDTVQSWYKKCDKAVPYVIDTEMKYQQPYIYKDDPRNRNYICCDLLNRKTHTPNIGSKNRVRYQFTNGVTIELERYAYKNNNGTNETLDLSTLDINIGVIIREVRYV